MLFRRMQYSFIAVLFLTFVTICYSSLPINNICVSPNNDDTHCTPLPTDLIQYLSFRSPHTCGAESQRVCWISANTNEEECKTCDSSDSSTNYPLSNLMDNSSYWISDGSSEAVIYLEGYKSNIIYQISISFLSSFPTATIIESLTQTSASYSPIAYFTNDCLAAPANLQSLCIEHSSTDTLQYYNDAGIESNAIRITFESQMQISGDRFYSHAIETVNVRGACDCNGHASECSGYGSDRYCLCQHNTNGRDCTSCIQGYYPSSDKDIFDPNYCEVGCECELCGVEDEFQACDPVTKECICKTNVEGDRCDRCKSGFNSLTFSNPTGCEECACDYAGAAALPCNATTGECYCREGFTGPTCDVEPGLYVPLLEEIFSIRNIASNLDTPTYVLIDAGVTSGRGWRVSSTDSFYTQFRVGGSGDYLFFPLITASSLDSMVVITLTSDNSESISYTIPATNISRWNVVLFLNSGFMYTISVELSSTSDLLVVEELLFLPLESTSISYDRLALESIYSLCIPYNIRSSPECGMAKDLSISITQSPLECDCYRKGSAIGYCESYGGQCNCIPGYGGRKCDECAPGLQMRDDGICGSCNCDPVKSETAACNSTGYCYCIDSVSIDETDKTCSSCNPGYIISSTGVCESCECSTAGSENHICDPVSGECVCRDGYEGSRCDRCQSTHIYTGDECLACPCPRTEGRNFADQCSYIEASVSCSCSEGFTGLQCEECDAGYFAEFADTGVLSGCRQCECSGKGIPVGGRICDAVTGQCLSCVGNTGGDNCEYCVDGFYQPDVQESCQACECDIMGSLENLCNRYTGVCECREGFSGEKCDRCAVNFFNSSNTCPACSSCFNQVSELYSSLQERIDQYMYLSQSGCTLLSPPLQELLYTYTLYIPLLRMDIVSVNQVDIILYSALAELAKQVEELNTEVLNLHNDANQEELRAEEIERTSELNYLAARNTLSKLGDLFKFYILQIQRLSNVLLPIFSQMLSNIQDVDIIVPRENDLVELQRLWIAESSQLSTSIMSSVEDTLNAALIAVELQSNTTRVVSWSFSLLRVLLTQVEYLNSTYMQVDDVAETAEEYLNNILSLVDFSPFNFPEFPHDTLSSDVLELEDFIKQLQEQVLSQVNRSNSEINRSQILVLRGEFLQSITNILLERLNLHKELAENAAQESYLLIQQITERQNEINTTHTESVLLVELLNQLFSLLNETQQNLTIQSCEDTLVLIQTAINNVTELSNQLVTVRNSVQRAIVDSRSANRTVSVMLTKVDLVEQSITEMSDRIDEVVVLTEVRIEHEDDGAAELFETETSLERVTRYTNYFKTRVDLLELEFMKLNQSLVGIGVVSEEEIESILEKLALLEAEALNNAERLGYTERDLLEEEKELEYLERAVYESYQQINEFDGLLSDIKEYNDQRGCA